MRAIHLQQEQQWPLLPSAPYLSRGENDQERGPGARTGLSVPGAASFLPVVQISLFFSVSCLLPRDRVLLSR